MYYINIYTYIYIHIHTHTRYATGTALSQPQVVTSKKPKRCSSLALVSPLKVTHLPLVWGLLLSMAYTPDRRDHRLLVSSERHRQMWGERNCLSFETAVGGIDSPALYRATTDLYKLCQVPQHQNIFTIYNQSHMSMIIYC